MGIQAYDPYDFTAGEPIHDILIKRIKQADFAIIVMTEKNINVFHEMGICEGLGKPLFVIVGKNMEPPYFVQKYVYLRSDLDNEELLKISLTKFVEDLLSNKLKLRRKPKTSKPGRLPLRSTDEYITRINKLREQGNALDVELLAEDIFRELNLQFESNRFSSQDKGVDFAIWDENLTFTIGNPLFIELKYGSLTFDQIHKAESQLKEYLARTEAKAAILLYLDKNGRRFRENYLVAPLVLRFEFEDFVRALYHNTFEEVILSKRNRMVHGLTE